MSNHLTSMAYKRDLGSITRKAVMVLLADKASDDGSGIWASKQRMADELCASKQTVLNALKSLIEDGLIVEAGRRKCANGYTIEYAINVEKLEAASLVKWHADQSISLTGQNPLPVKDVDPTSQSAGPDQSISLTQTSLNRSEPPSNNTARKPDDLDPQVWKDWKRVRNKPITPTVMASVEREAAKLGWTVSQAITHAAESSWQGFKAKWVESNTNDNNRGGSLADIGDQVRQLYGY